MQKVHRFLKNIFSNTKTDSSSINYKNIFKISSFRAQSAMEYLMTYGWSILVIAIGLVTLFALGVF